ncbi:MAG: hypothetical protein L0312_02800 [Acidobacteria bacterium]|nr:hypothetical protein [Acidobacteriota bacterium]
MAIFKTDQYGRVMGAPGGGIGGAINPNTGLPYSSGGRIRKVPVEQMSKDVYTPRTLPSVDSTEARVPTSPVRTQPKATAGNLGTMPVARRRTSLPQLYQGGVPSYKRGTRFVKKTGVAQLHRGEMVLNAREAKKYRKGGKVSAAASTLGAGKKKVPTKSQRLIRAAGHEMKVSPPEILRKTKRKKGAETANKQRVAILLNKARAAGADIPRREPQ